MEEEGRRLLSSLVPRTKSALLRCNIKRALAIAARLLGVVLGILLLVFWLKGKATQLRLAKERDTASLHIGLLKILLRGISEELQGPLQREILETVRDFPNSPYVVVTALQLRLFRKLYKSKEGTLSKFESELFNILHENLFNWVGERGIEGLSGIAGSRGLVITTGSKMLPLTMHVINSVRSVWNCQLPIEVFYNGEKDLSAEARSMLEDLPGVKVIDLNNILNISSLQLEGWDVKPFAMLASSFESVLLLDADVVFAKSPDIYFKFGEFERSGTLFFYDRIFKVSKFDYRPWFRTILPEPFSDKLVNSSLYRGLTNFQQESGIVLIDKERRLWGLLAACLLNRPREKEKMSQATWGEKETFWIGFEMAEEPYEFLETDAGSIGVALYNRFVKQQVLCGHLAHFDKDGELLWFNDGIVENKRAKVLSPGTFIHADNKGSWYKLCLVARELRILGQEQLHKLDKLRELWLAQAA